MNRKIAYSVIGGTTSHLTRLSKNDSQVIGYSHSTRLSKDDNQVAGYPAQSGKRGQSVGWVEAAGRNPSKPSLGALSRTYERWVALRFTHPTELRRNDGLLA